MTPKPNPRASRAPADTLPTESGSLAPLRQRLVEWAAGQFASAPTSGHPVGVAFSGGMDSTALLHLAAGVWPGAVLAFHVNHGLQVAADTFEAHCRAEAQALGVAFQSERVQVRLRGGESMEEQARLSRYAALARLARAAGASTVLLAQHANDQVESVLLALTRGAGVAGLAGMPALMEREGIRFGRPLLSVPLAVLQRCVQEQGWAFVDDPTNTDLRFTRNRLRHELVPALLGGFPQAMQSVARSARHCAEAQDLLTELAEHDLGTTGTPPALALLRGLSRSRQANALRHWLKREAGRTPSTAQLAELLDQIESCATRGHDIRIRVVRGWVLRSGAVLRYAIGDASPLRPQVNLPP